MATQDQGVSKVSGPSAAQSRPTLKDVAFAAGVSKSTASLVLRDAGNISESTRERVRYAMAGLGYVYNRGAAAMREGSTRSIGLITPNSSNIFMGQFIESFDLAFVARGFTTLSVHSYEDPARQDALIRALLERGVDGLAVMPAIASDEQLESSLPSIDVPAVVSVRAMPGSVLTTVSADNYLGGQLAAEHIIGQECRSVGYIGAPHALVLRPERLAGITKVLTENGMHLAFDVPTALTAQAARAVMTALLQEAPLPEALICHNDTIAFGVLRALRDYSPDLLERTLVIGFDGIVEAELWEPPLTTVAIPAGELGRQSADALADKLKGDAEVKSVVLTPELVVRKS